ncbi:MAG: hypothetical protein ABIH00_11715, partial [Armatimonadota bacterium]
FGGFMDGINPHNGNAKITSENHLLVPIYYAKLHPDIRWHVSPRFYGFLDELIEEFFQSTTHGKFDDPIREITTSTYLDQGSERPMVEKLMNKALDEALQKESPAADFLKALFEFNPNIRKFFITQCVTFRIKDSKDRPASQALTNIILDISHRNAGDVLKEHTNRLDLNNHKQSLRNDLKKGLGTFNGNSHLKPNGLREGLKRINGGNPGLKPGSPVKRPKLPRPSW